MAASLAQQQQFVTYWTPYAKQAGSSLGIPWQWVLQQWAHESGWSLQTSGTNNPGGIKTIGSRVAPSTFANFSSPEAFVKNYVGTFQSDFPAYNLLKNGTTTHMSIMQLFGGNQIYNPNNPNYASEVAAIAQNLSALGITSPTSALIKKTSGTPLLGTLSAGQNTTTNAINSVGEWFGSIAGVVGIVGAFLGGMLLIVLGGILLLRSEESEVLDNVVPFRKKAKEA